MDGQTDKTNGMLHGKRYKYNDKLSYLRLEMQIFVYIYCLLDIQITVTVTLLK